MTERDRTDDPARSDGLAGAPDDHEMRGEDEDGGTLDRLRDPHHRDPDELGRLDPAFDPMSNDNR